jgi:hypothetical protein
MVARQGKKKAGVEKVESVARQPQEIPHPTGSTYPTEYGYYWLQQEDEVKHGTIQ